MKISYDPGEDSVEMVVARGHRNARANAFLLMVIGCFFGAMGAVAVFTSPFAILGFIFSVVAFSMAYYGFKDWMRCKRGELFPVWLSIEKEQKKTLLAYKPALSFGNSIREIYQIDERGNTLSLDQAVRLFRVYIGQNKYLKNVEKRLEEISAVHQEIAEKLAQLQQLGQAHESGALNLAIVAVDREKLEAERERIQNSCRRLENIVDSARNAARIRRLNRELDDLQAQLPQAATPTVEPTFAAESLEEIERQIGREIETYLQLERETDEHLREL